MKINVSRQTLVVSGLVFVVAIIVLIAWERYDSSPVDVKCSSNLPQDRVGSRAGLTDYRSDKLDGMESSTIKNREQKSKKDKITARMRGVRGRMKISEFNRSKLLGQWKTKYGFKTAFLVETPQQSELKEWRSLLGVYPGYSKTEKNYVNAYSEQLAQDFYFPDNFRYRLIIFETDLTHQDAELTISSRFLRTRDTITTEGGEVKLPTSGGRGHSVGEVEVSNIDENWRYSELLDMGPIKAGQTPDEK